MPPGVGYPAGPKPMRSSVRADPAAETQQVDAVLANRRSLNANRRTAKPQPKPQPRPSKPYQDQREDMLKGGNMAVSPVKPQMGVAVNVPEPGAQKPAWMQLREAGISGQGSAAANKALAGNPDEMAIKGFAAANPGISEDFIRRAAPGAQRPMDPSIGGTMPIRPPQGPQAPPQLGGVNTMDMQMPVDPAMQQAPPPGFSANLSPDIMNRLDMLRPRGGPSGAPGPGTIGGTGLPMGGPKPGMAPGAPAAGPTPFGAGPAPVNFADYWRGGGGMPGGNMPVGMY